MKSLLIPIAVAFALAGAPAEASPPPAHGHAVAAAPAATPKAPKLQADLRALWHGHVVQTRAYALAVHANKPTAASQAAAGVVANAKALSAAVASFYGPAAGTRMLELLAGHWGGVKALTDAQRKADTAGVQQATAGLVANAGQIATFLAGANPHLPEDAVRGLLVAHGAHHAAQVQQLMAGDTAGEAKTWKAMQAHMDVIADALAGAIARQFPAKVG
ncbi:hypothetical protein ACFQZQ_06360 [Lysobacter koreensis]|uniref:Uncharacterized protein n=1 Tax=Lysobacter koreensis TaxID=266122 RepID=A0ABW2YLD5_9GAMM